MTKTGNTHASQKRACTRGVLDWCNETDTNRAADAANKPAFDDATAQVTAAGAQLTKLDGCNASTLVECAKAIIAARAATQEVLSHGAHHPPKSVSVH